MAISVLYSFRPITSSLSTSSPMCQSDNMIHSCSRVAAFCPVRTGGTTRRDAIGFACANRSSTASSSALPLRSRLFSRVRWRTCSSRNTTWFSGGASGDCLPSPCRSRMLRILRCPIPSRLWIMRRPSPSSTLSRTTSFSMSTAVAVIVHRPCCRFSLCQSVRTFPKYG